MSQFYLRCRTLTYVCLIICRLIRGPFNKSLKNVDKFALDHTILIVFAHYTGQYVYDRYFFKIINTFLVNIRMNSICNTD